MTSTPINLPKPKPSKKKISIYLGDPGMWSWVLHRITGLAIFFFLFVHVLDTAVLAIGPTTYDEVVNTYKNPVMGIGEIGLVVALLFHALNGIRVILVDFWSEGPRHQRTMLWIVIAFWIILSAGMAIRLGSILISFMNS